MWKGVILDLDQTLVNTSSSEQYRRQRNWSMVYSLIPNFNVYPGVKESLDFFVRESIKISIVTTSPGVYAKKVLNHFNIPFNILIDYFSVQNKKPHPESMQLASQRMNLKPNEIISFGDRAIDIESSNKAGIVSVACLWGTKEKDILLASNPTHVLHLPKDILELFSGMTL